MIPKLHTLIYDLPNNEYHAIKGTTSSTQFKDLLDDEDVFIKKHITKEVEKLELAAFDVGSYFHTGVLEPHRLKADCIVYPGKVRRGRDWDKFKAKHKDKAIVTQFQKDQAMGLVKAVKDSPVAQEYLVGKSEVSLFTKIGIKNGIIHAPFYGKVLTINGWTRSLTKETKFDYELIIRVRADKLGDTFISDLKSTTGNAKSNKSMREKISYYQYDLSAALYLDMFSLKLPSVREFIWIFASKELFNSKTYRASQKNIRVGRAKWMRAVLKLADCAQNNWQSADYLDVLEPLPHEEELIREKDTDLV